MAVLQDLLATFQEKVAAQSVQDALFYEALLTKLKNPPVPAAVTDNAVQVMNTPVPTANTETMSEAHIETISETNTDALYNATVSADQVMTNANLGNNGQNQSSEKLMLIDHSSSKVPFDHSSSKVSTQAYLQNEQDLQNIDLTKNEMKWCECHKYNESHVTEDCHFLLKWCDHHEYNESRN